MAIDENKPTILLATDSAMAHTGLGRVTRSIFNRIARMGKYNLVQLGWGHNNLGDPVEFEIIPTEITADKKFAPEDENGQKTFPKLVEAIRPNLVWVCADPWRIQHYVENPYRNRYTLVGYCAIDSEPVRAEYVDILSKLDYMVPYCQWAADLCKAQGLENVTEPIGHGVDPDVFYPLPEDQRSATRKMNLAIPNEQDAIVLGSMGRNMSRKNLPAVIMALHHLVYGYYSVCESCGRSTPWGWSRGAKKVNWTPEVCSHCGSSSIRDGKKYPNMYWYYHGPIVDIGWDLGAVAASYCVEEHVRMNPLTRPRQGLVDQGVNMSFNAMDIYVHTATCEGWGLPILEAMSAGKPCVITDSPPYREWTGPCTHVRGHEFIEAVLDTTRHIVDTSALIDKIAALASDKKLREEMGQASRAQAVEMTWDSVADQWATLLEKVCSVTSIAPWRRVVSV